MIKENKKIEDEVISLNNSNIVIHKKNKKIGIHNTILNEHLKKVIKERKIKIIKIICSYKLKNKKPYFYTFKLFGVDFFMNADKNSDKFYNEQNKKGLQNERKNK